MPINTNTNVAPLGGRPSAADLANRFAAPRSSVIPDPRAEIMQGINGMPTQVPSPEVPRGIPVMEGEQQISTMQDVADLGGSQFAPGATHVPLVDADNNPIVDPVTGEMKMRAFGPQDYNSQLSTERDAFASVQEPVRQISENPVQNAQTGLKQLFGNELAAAENGWGLNSRDDFKLENRAKTLQSYIEDTSTDLATVVDNSKTALFSYDTKGALQGADGASIPAGFQVMADNEIYDEQVMNVIATVAGLGFSQAITQMGVHKEAGQNVAAERRQQDFQEPMSNIINSVRHSIVNGMSRNGIKLKDGAVDQLAKATVFHHVNEGNLIPTNDEQGRSVLEPSESLKAQAMRLQRISEAVTGDTKRKGASSTPTHSGASFTTGKAKMTKGAPTTLKYSRRIADMTKNILGAVGQVYRSKDVKRKAIELDMVMSPEFVERDGDGNFKYSNHPMAERNGVHKGAYTAAQYKVKRPKNFNAADPRAAQEFAKIQEEEALKVMSEKEAQLKFDMMSVGKTKGVVFSEWIHSPSNQRFYPNSYNTDYMGSKNVIRDMLSFAHQDSIVANSLFDPRPIEILKRKAQWALRGSGVEIAKNLEGLTPNELGSLGAMHNAVMFYYTSLDNSIHNVTKMTVADAIDLYTPAIGTRLAGIGQKYNEFLADQKIEPDNEMMGLWQNTEKGEALATLNLWDDFFKAKTMADNPATARHSFALTHHSIDDGNQNGIFLQALFFGLRDANDNAAALARLSVADPNMADMRVFGMDKMMHHLQEIVKDSTDRSKGWSSFWAEAILNHPDGMDGVAKDFFKKPLMQNAYGKDAGMFNDVLMDMIETNDKYSTLAKKHLLDTGVYNDMVDAGLDLTGAVELALRQIIDSKSVKMMQNIGRFSGVMNKPMVIPGPSGDDLVIVPVGASPINKAARSSDNIVRVQLPNGDYALTKRPQYESDTFVNPTTGEMQEIPTYRMLPQTDATKGVQRFWNRKKQKYDEFNNARGTTVARQFAVLTIQAIDGDLVKLTTVAVNKNRMGRPGKTDAPRPVMFVHDSIISTPGSSLVYTNAYNNIAIPGSIPAIAGMGKTIQEFIHRGEQEEKHKVITRGEPVGIGSNGEYSSMGAVFDEFDARLIELGKPADYAEGSLTMPNDYKALFLKRARTSAKARKKQSGVQGPYDAQKRFEKRMAEDTTFEASPEGQWDKYSTRLQSIMVDARKLGWVPERELSSADAPNLAIEAKSFAPLLDLSAELLNLKNFRAWTDDFARRVNNAHNRLKMLTKVGGIRQMSSSGGKAGPNDGYKAIPNKSREPEALKTADPNTIKPLDAQFDVSKDIPF